MRLQSSGVSLALKLLPSEEQCFSNLGELLWDKVGELLEAGFLIHTCSYETNWAMPRHGKFHLKQLQNPKPNQAIFFLQSVWSDLRMFQVSGLHVLCDMGANVFPNSWRCVMVGIRRSSTKSSEHKARHGATAWRGAAVCKAL